MSERRAYFIQRFSKVGLRAVSHLIEIPRRNTQRTTQHKWAVASLRVWHEATSEDASIIARASAGVFACHAHSHARTLVCFALLPMDFWAKERQLCTFRISKMIFYINEGPVYEFLFCHSMFQLYVVQVAVLQRVLKVHGSGLKDLTQRLYLNFIWNCYIVFVT